VRDRTLRKRAGSDPRSRTLIPYRANEAAHPEVGETNFATVPHSQDNSSQSLLACLRCLRSHHNASQATIARNDKRGPRVYRAPQGPLTLINTQS
jgi:hypothetical protein